MCVCVMGFVGWIWVWDFFVFGLDLCCLNSFSLKENLKMLVKIKIPEMLF